LKLDKNIVLPFSTAISLSECNLRKNIAQMFFNAEYFNQALCLWSDDFFFLFGEGGSYIFWYEMSMPDSHCNVSWFSKAFLTFDDFLFINPFVTII